MNTEEKLGTEEKLRTVQIFLSSSVFLSCQRSHFLVGIRARPSASSTAFVDFSVTVSSNEAQHILI